MSYSAYRLSARIAIAVALSAVVSLPGCGWLTGKKIFKWPLSSDGAASTLSADDRAALASENWVQTVDSDSDDSVRRWRNGALEDLLSRPADSLPDLKAALDDEDAIVSGNAAIGLARGGDPTGAEQLVKTVRSPNIAMPMRRAAIEALGELETDIAWPNLKQLVEQYGPSDGEKTANHNEELQVELIRVLPAHDEVVKCKTPNILTDWWRAALRSPSADVRLEAVTAIVREDLVLNAVDLIDLRTDNDYRVRAAALLAIARVTDDRNHGYISAGLRDTDLRVRVAAVEAMGKLAILKHPEAIDSLDALLKNHPERIRAAAVAALAECSASDSLVDAASDESWRVRLEVAKALPKCMNRQGTILALGFLDDPSVQVQQAAVDAMAEWPLEKAGPVLLTAMDKPGYMLRKKSAQLLASRWKDAKQFNVDAPPQRRAEVLAKLNQAFRQRWGFGDQSALAEASQRNAAACERVTPQSVARVEQMMYRRDVHGLIALGPELPPTLEHLVYARRHTVQEFVYTDVLPSLDPAFKILNDFKARDMRARRKASQQLLELSKTRPLGRLALERLANIATYQEDQLVWANIMTVISDNGSEPAIRLAYMAISDSSSEIRRRACEHLAAYGDPRHSPVLLPALNDSSPSVVAAAVRALGATGDKSVAGELKLLLADANEHLRLEIALALAKLGDPDGVAALERLAYADAPTIRNRLAAGIGELNQPSLMPMLIQMLDDERVGVRRAAMTSLAEMVGRDVSQNEEGLPPTTDQRVERWKQWYRQTGQSMTGRSI